MAGKRKQSTSHSARRQNTTAWGRDHPETPVHILNRLNSWTLQSYNNMCLQCLSKTYYLLQKTSSTEPSNNKRDERIRRKRREREQIKVVSDAAAERDNVNLWFIFTVCHAHFLMNRLRGDRYRLWTWATSQFACSPHSNTQTYMRYMRTRAGAPSSETAIKDPGPPGE